ncbi:MAG: hypothetical protein IJL76_00595 [Bacilli bacterium]|nr:hypothetical protein [Bacilli bacterium]
MIDLEKNQVKKSKFFITVFLSVLAALLLSVSVGFSALNQNLNIAGDIEYDEHSNLLYDVLKREAKKGTYAKEYTGDHRDSYTEEPTKSIYHWYAENNTTGNQLANEILDKNNVIFGNFCWQIIRTTDTGGVKLIYNGVPNEGQCNNTGTEQQIMTSKYNSLYNSLADIGYMYNTRYTATSNNTTTPTILLSYKGMTDYNYYYYGTGIEYIDGNYNLTGVTRAEWRNKYNNSKGLYTCASTTDTTCSTVYYIAGGVRTMLYGFKLSNGNLVDYYNTNIVIADSYTKDNRTFIMNNPITITKEEWYDNQDSYIGYYTCGNTNDSCTNLHYICGAYGYYYTKQDATNYIYASGFTYYEDNNMYTLNNDREQSPNPYTVNHSHRYSCFNETGECTEIRFLLDSSSRSLNGQSGYSYLYSMKMSNGKSIENIKDEMLYDDNVNQLDSTIKSNIDNWYLENMTTYTNKIEDTIFCNNRVQNNPIESAWNPIEGHFGNAFYFKNYVRNEDLACTNSTDKLSINNLKANLSYPVGLLTAPETYLLNNYKIVKTGQRYWTISPSHFYPVGGAMIMYIYDSGELYNGYNTGWELGVRPVISLKPGTEYISGTGSKDNPYIVE